ncbi:MAG TPA: hypothetical protein EYQ50_27120 [Verrucomicrobiales bacterium]|nr:hypothetical protein [Verrucomicrobiales bacterium]
MKPEYDPLLTDLLSDSESEGFRRELLKSTLTSLRRRRQCKRMAVIGLSSLCEVMLVLSLIHNLNPASNSKPVVQRETDSEPLLISQDSAAESVIPGTGIRILSDEELYRLLADRPIAMITAGKHTELIFLNELPTADPVLSKY